MPAETLIWRTKAPDCRHHLHLIDPYSLLGLLRFFPLERVRSKSGDQAELVYNVKSGLLGGKTKIKVSIERGATETRLVGTGPLSIELRVACPGSDTLLLSLHVAGKLSDKLSRADVEKIFEELKRLVAEMMEIEGAAPAPMQAPTAPSPQPRLHAPPANPAPAAPDAAMPPPAETPRASVFDKTLCMVKLVTGGFPVDEELSRRIPSEYSPKIRTGRVVDSGVELAERLDLLRYDDKNYLIRLGFGDARADVVRLADRGVVGVYYRGPRGEELYGAEAAARIAEEACVPGKRIGYWVVEI